MDKFKRQVESNAKVNLINMPVSGIYQRVNESSKNNLQYYEPLGLLYLASSLRKASYRVDLIDLNIERTYDSIETAAARCMKGTRIIGISAYTMLHQDIVNLANAIKQLDGSAIVIVGGQHATFADVELLKSGGVDYVVRNEGEATLVELVARLENGSSPESTAGISYIKNGKVVRNPQRDVVKDLDSIPFPARDLVASEYYSIGKELTITSSRGCTGKCIFCTSPNFWKPTVRFRSPKNVGEELLEFFTMFGPRIPPDLKINFVDDNMTAGGESRFKAILEYLKMTEHRFELYSRIDTMSLGMLAALQETLVSKIRFGIESGSDHILKLLRKGQSKEKITRTLEMAAGHGIELHGTFMVGLPTETEDEVRESIEFACQLPLDYAFFFVCTPYPGTELWERYVSDKVDFKACDNMNAKEDRFGEYDRIKPQRKLELLAEAYERFYFGHKRFEKPAGYENAEDPLERSARVTDLIFSRYFR